MTLFKKILVPLDGSGLAERALEPALALAQQVDGEIVLLSIPYLKHMFVTEPAGYGFLLPEQSVELTRQELEQYLESVQQSWRHPNVTMRAQVIKGDEAGVIVDTAEAESVDLILMSSHGRSGISRWLLGSITEKVLRSAPCPVLVVRSEEPLSKILLALDGSDLSEKALEPGLEVGRCLGSQVVLLRVKEPATKVSLREMAELDSLEKGLGERLEESINESEEAYLQAIADRYAAAGVEIYVEVRNGPAAQRILEFADAWGADLIAMATHGRTGLQRWAYGSVTEKILRSTQCAMLIVRPPADEMN